MLANRFQKENLGFGQDSVNSVKFPLHRQEGLLPRLLSALHAKGILTDDLTLPGEAGSHQKKYMGVAR